MNIFNKAAGCYLSGIKVLDFLLPLFDLVLRIWVARVFFQSGLAKIQSWDTTLMLFEYEYEVPFISPSLAAWLGTGVELILPVLLLIGLISRPTALGLFIFNIIAAISYPDISAAGIKDHMMWGIVLSVTFFHGPGRLSLDHWLCRKCCNT